MIEVIYKDESQDVKSGEEPFGLPRNIRQIGLVRDDYKIYMEDYVYTFLVRLARSENVSGETKAQVAVLTGEIKWRSQTAYLFIKGAMMAEDMDAAPDHIDFSGEQWKKIQKEQEKYFAEQEIVGWFFSQPQLMLEVSELMTKIHMKHFGGEKVLMLMEPQEREDAFFHYENNEMVHLGGYYLYYEKNPSMQTYMIDKNKELQPEVQEHYEDQAVKDFRKIITDKKETKKIIENLMKEYEKPSIGMKIIELDGAYQMCTKSEMYEYLIRIAKQPKKHVLTDVLLETLSIIAYKQPITKVEIEKIRGVSCDHAVNKLVEYNLVKELGRLDAPGRPLLFGTTEEFLRSFGVQSLDELPMLDQVQIEEFKQEAEEEMKVKLDI